MRNLTILLMLALLSGIQSVRAEDPIHQKDESATGRRKSKSKAASTNQDYVTHEKIDGNSELANANFIILCTSGKNDELLSSYKRNGDIVLKALLPKILADSSQVSGSAIRADSGLDSISSFISRERTRFDSNFPRAQGDRELKERLDESFRRVEERLREMNQASRQEKPTSECSEEDIAAIKILKALNKAGEARVFVEVDCSTWKGSTILKQLAKPYRNIVLQEKT